MDSTITRPGRKQGTTLLYGYRITVLRESYKSIALPTIFAPDVPDIWHQLRSDETVITATLRRRGLVVDRYQRTEVQV